MTRFDPFADVPGDDSTKTFADLFTAADKARADVSRLDGLRRRLAAATDRPWYLTSHEGREIRVGHTLLAIVCSGIGAGPDAALIACAPADIDWLLTELDNTRAELAAANAAAAHANFTINDLCAAAWLAEEAAR